VALSVFHRFQNQYIWTEQNLEFYGGKIDTLTLLWSHDDSPTLGQHFFIKCFTGHFLKKLGRGG
jgi:hypothetical protein